MNELVWYTFIDRIFQELFDFYVLRVKLIFIAVKNSPSLFELLGGKTGFTSDGHDSCILRMLKIVSRYSLRLAAVLERTVKSSIHALMAFFIVSNKNRIVDWKHADTFFNPSRTRLETNVPRGAMMPHAS